MIDIVYFTYNRLSYTRITLPALIENAGAAFSLTIIDNGSTDGTVDYLKGMQEVHGDTIRKVLFNTTNKGLSLPTNVFWRMSRAELVGKVDNDTLVPDGWLARMLEAHTKCDKLGVIGGFHFNLKYVDQKALARRAVSVDGVALVPDAFIGGCCYLMRKTVQQHHGYLVVDSNRKTTGWTEYQQAVMRSGYINGYLYPLLLVEHFDDPLDEHNLAFTKHVEMSDISMGEKGIRSREEQLKWYVRDARRVESGRSLAEMGIYVPISDLPDEDGANKKTSGA